MYAAGSTMTAKALDHELADRIRFLGIVADAERWASVILAALVTGGVAIAIAITRAFDEAGGTSNYRATTIITLAILVSALLVGTHLWNVARLNREPVSGRSSSWCPSRITRTRHRDSQ